MNYKTSFLKYAAISLAFYTVFNLVASDPIKTDANQQKKAKKLTPEEMGYGIIVGDGKYRLDVGEKRKGERKIVKDEEDEENVKQPPKERGYGRVDEDKDEKQHRVRN